MKIKKDIEALYSMFEEHRLQGRVVSIQHLQDLQDGIENHHSQGLFDDEFYQEGFFLIASDESLSKDFEIYKSYAARRIIDYLQEQHFNSILEQL